jgi:hypothetical protein
MFLRRKSIIEMQDELTKFAIAQLGFGPVGEIRMITPGSGNAHNYFRSRVLEANFHAKTGAVWEAEAAMVSGRNDVMLVTPDSHAWRGDAGATATLLTWDKSNAHILGLSPTSKAGYNRARFSHAGYTMINFMTVSGDDNCFKNLRWMHGAATGGALDVTLMTISGVGNRFENIGFAGPNNAAQAAATGYKSIVISGSHNYFKDCMFGSVNDVDRSVANTILSFTTGCGGWNIFENCVFRSRSGGGQSGAFFINDAVTDTVVDFTAIFLNCQFLHQGTSLAAGITKAANTSRKLFFDNRCTFAGVSTVIAAAREAEIIWGGGGASPDTSGLNDALGLGLARAINTA